MRALSNGKSSYQRNKPDRPRKLFTHPVMFAATLVVIIIIAVAAFKIYVTLPSEDKVKPLTASYEIVRIEPKVVDYTPNEDRKFLLHKVWDAVEWFILNALSGFSSAEAAENTKEKGCISKGEVQNIEVIISNEILSADNDISLRTKLFEARGILDDLRSRLKTCNDENSKGHIKNAIIKIESVIEKVKEAAEEKVSLHHSIERNETLKKFDIERIKGRPDFRKLEEIIEEYSRSPEASEEVTGKMKRVFRAKCEETGRDVMTQLNAYIVKKKANDASEEYNYLVKNGQYLIVMEVKIPRDDFEYYKREVIRIGGKIEEVEKVKDKEPEVPEELKDISDSKVHELAKDLHGDTTESVKMIDNGKTNVMDDLKDLGVKDSTDESKPTSSFDDIMKDAIEEKKEEKIEEEKKEEKK